ncbi:MAG: molybdopterin-dependent oxidoreductase [Candidatus Odinarchaeota archaeon]
MKLNEQLTRKRNHIILTLVFILIGTSVYLTILINVNQKSSDGFPDFITKTSDYYITRINDVPNINPDSYRLLVRGQINNPKNFTLSELLALPLTERTLTTECIGNPPKGPLLSTAIWKGFLVYDLLDSMGLKANATGVKYLAADGYYVSNTIDQIRDNGTIGALYMNNKILPPEQGFPIRIVNPGSYGAKQPAWVIEMEVIDKPLEDYWDDKGWDTSPPMEVDSTIFFPKDNINVKVGVPFDIGGAAFGGTRIRKIEYIIDGNLNWSQATIVKSLDLDHVWIFWKITIIFEQLGSYTIYTKATDIYNNSQPQIDLNIFDGNNGWPSLLINVVE